MPPSPATTTERVALVLVALIRAGEQGATTAELAQQTGVPAPVCRSILLRVSRTVPVYDVPAQQPGRAVRWYVVQS